MVKCFTGFPSREEKSKPVCVCVCVEGRNVTVSLKMTTNKITLFSILLFSPLHILGNSFIMALKIYLILKKSLHSVVW